MCPAPVEALVFKAAPGPRLGHRAYSSHSHLLSASPGNRGRQGWAGGCRFPEPLSKGGPGGPGVSGEGHRGPSQRSRHAAVPEGTECLRDPIPASVSLPTGEGWSQMQVRGNSVWAVVPGSCCAVGPGRLGLRRPAHRDSSTVPLPRWALQQVTGRDKGWRQAGCSGRRPLPSNVRAGPGLLSDLQRGPGCRGSESV